MSRSADLAYSFGRIRFDVDGARAIDAHYIHLWLRDAGGASKLALDVVLPRRPASAVPTILARELSMDCTQLERY